MSDDWKLKRTKNALDLERAQPHCLERIVKELGLTECRAHFRCSCGALGPDHGWQTGGDRRGEAIERCRADFKLHSEGKSPTEGDGDTPEGIPWDERHGGEG